MEATFTKRMKRISLMALAMLLFGVQSVWAQVNGDFRSRQSGEWADFNTWQKYNNGWSNAVSGEVPSATASVFIENGHDVTVNTLSAACKDLNISTATTPATKASLTVGTTTASNLTLNGRFKGYTGSVSNGTHTYSALGTADLSTPDGTITADGTISRTLIESGEWNSASNNFDLVIAPGAGVQLTLNAPLGVQNLSVNSGSLIAGTNTLFVENNVSIAGEFISQANTVISQLSGNNAGTLTLTNTGELGFTGATPVVKMNTMALTDGTVYYQMSGGNQNILVEEGDGGALEYGDVVVKNSNKLIPTGEIFKVTKSLTIESGSTLELNAATLNLHANGTITGAGSINADPAATINIDGISSGATSTVPLKFVASDELGTLILNRAGLEATLSSPIILTEDITLNIGVLNSISNTLTLKDQTVTVTAGSGSSYVDGPVTRHLDGSLGNSPVTFPVGKGGNYRPLELDIALGSTGINTYVANQIESAYGNPSNLPSGVTHVSGVRYFTLVQSSAAATVTSSALTFNFGENDGVDGQVSKLTIVGSNGTGWDNLGNSSSVNNGELGGSIKSANNIASFGTFILANTSNVVGERNSLFNNTLPVELISFDGAFQRNQVNLSWSTATEKNNNYFVVERGTTVDNFIAIATVKGKGTTSTVTNYTATDKQPLNGVSFYRLKQVDFDGTVAYSKIISVATKGGSKAGVSVYPNPASENLTLVLPAEGKNIQVSVINLLGQTVLSEKIEVSGNTSQLNVSNLPAGTYQLQVTSTVGSSVVKFIKATL